MSSLSSTPLPGAPHAPALVTFGIPLLALGVAAAFIAGQMLAAKRLNEIPKRSEFEQERG